MYTVIWLTQLPVEPGPFVLGGITLMKSAGVPLMTVDIALGKTYQYDPVSGLLQNWP